MLYRSELKKMVFTQRGILLLCTCLVLKCVFLIAVPEVKDSRILLSQNQYDKYLSQLHGENTPKKTAWILEDHEKCKQIIASREEMERKHNTGSLSSEQWESYLADLERSYLHENASEIFAQKAEAFASQSDSLPPAHYIYEYGWQTIFTLLLFPDIFLLIPLLFLTAQCFPFEVQNGMLPVLLSCKQGRISIWTWKAVALLTISVVSCVLFGGTEMACFFLRGWCNDLEAPMYSVKILTDCRLSLSLGEAYLLALSVRSIGTILFVYFIFALSVWLKNSLNLIFLGLCLLALLLLWNTSATLFTPAGMLSGTKVLTWIGQTGNLLSIALIITIGYTSVLLLLSVMKYRKGLG